MSRLNPECLFPLYRWLLCGFCLLFQLQCQGPRGEQGRIGPPGPPGSATTAPLPEGIVVGRGAPQMLLLSAYVVSDQGQYSVGRQDSSWIRGLRKVAVGEVTLDLDAQRYTTIPNCWLTSSAGVGVFLGFQSVTTSQIAVRLFRADGMPLDASFFVTCLGPAH